ncbi:MAG: hypothetical protein CHACPFDD_02516 [Phycisphaerae bacterium]|nr:hypothetical protein [Phycisphaerae bacterium]
MKTKLYVILGLVLVIAGVFWVPRWLATGPRAVPRGSVDEMLNYLASVMSAEQRDAAVRALAKRGPEVVEPLLARYKTEPAASQIRLSAVNVFSLLDPAAGIDALQKLAKIESDPAVRAAIMGQIDMLRTAQNPAP